MNKEILYEYGWFLILSTKMKRSLIRPPAPLAPLWVMVNVAAFVVNVLLWLISPVEVEGLGPLRTCLLKTANFKGQIHSNVSV